MVSTAVTTGIRERFRSHRIERFTESVIRDMTRLAFRFNAINLAQGFPDFEVRVKCHSRRDAQHLAERLRAEGLRCVQRWQFVVLAAEDEDAAQALADRIRAEAPPGTTVTAEASVGEVATEAPLATPFGPFAVFGGLGG